MKTETLILKEGQSLFIKSWQNTLAYIRSLPETPEKKV